MAYWLARQAITMSIAKQGLLKNRLCGTLRDSFTGLPEA
jgi:hypothetical protein